MQKFEPNKIQSTRNPAEPRQLSYSTYESIEEKVRTGVARGSVRILYTDIDATLVVGAGHTENEIAKSHQDAKELVAYLNRQDTIVIPITGSHFDSATKTTHSVLNRIESNILPRVGDSWVSESFRVDAYVADGGARAVKSQLGETIVGDECYQERVAPTKLDYDQVLSQAQALALIIEQLPLDPLNWQTINGFDKNAGETRLFLQAGTADGRHRDANKVAFYFYANTLADRDLIETKFNALVGDFALKVVCCEEKDANTHARRTIPAANESEGFPLKYCLDIVPYSKASAIEYFHGYISALITQEALHQKVARPKVEVWACGDSGNDIPLLSSPMVTHAVIVGGASAELTRSRGRLEELGKEVYTENEATRIGPASILEAVTKHDRLLR